MNQIRPKRESPHNSSRRYRSKDGSNLETKSRLVSVESAMNLEARLQQPIEDDVIINEMIQLQTRIESHTNNFYHKDDVRVNHAELQTCIEDRVLPKTPEKVLELSNLLLESKSRAVGIRIAISRILFASIDFFGDCRHTLLLPDAVSLISASESKGGSDEAQEYYQLALARFRILAAFLLPALDTKRQLTPTETQVRDAIDTINYVLMPFVGERYIGNKGKEEREANLTSIVTRVARLGRLLFAQPTMWAFVWDMPKDSKRSQHKQNKVVSDSSKGVVVFPAIWKTGDTEGKALSSPILIREPEIHSSALISSISRIVKKTFQSNGNAPPRKEVASQEEESRPRTTQSERLQNRAQTEEIHMASDTADNNWRGQQDSAVPKGGKENHERCVQPSHQPLSSRRTHDSEQNGNHGSATVDKSHGLDTLDHSSIVGTEQRRGSESTGADPTHVDVDDIVYQDSHGQQPPPGYQPYPELREDAERAGSTSKQFQFRSSQTPEAKGDQQERDRAQMPPPPLPDRPSRSSAQAQEENAKGDINLEPPTSTEDTGDRSATGAGTQNRRSVQESQQTHEEEPPLRRVKKRERIGFGRSRSGERTSKQGTGPGIISPMTQSKAPARKEVSTRSGDPVGARRNDRAPESNEIEQEQKSITYSAQPMFQHNFAKNRASTSREHRHDPNHSTHGSWRGFFR